MRLDTCDVTWRDGRGQLWRGRDHLDLEKFGPEFAGDEEAVVHGVLGDAVEHRFGIGDFSGLKQAGEVDPAEHPA